MASPQGLGCKRLEKSIVTFCKSQVCHSSKPALEGLWQRKKYADRGTAGLAAYVIATLRTPSLLRAPVSCHSLWLMPSGQVGLPPGAVQRGVLVLLQTLAPYLADRIGGTTAPLLSAPWASHHSSDHHTTIPSPHVASTGDCIYPFCILCLMSV